MVGRLNGSRKKRRKQKKTKQHGITRKVCGYSSFKNAFPWIRNVLWIEIGRKKTVGENSRNSIKRFGVDDVSAYVLFFCWEARHVIERKPPVLHRRAFKRPIYQAAKWRVHISRISRLCALSSSSTSLSLILLLVSLLLPPFRVCLYSYNGGSIYFFYFMDDGRMYTHIFSMICALSE